MISYTRYIAAVGVMLSAMAGIRAEEPSDTDLLADLLRAEERMVEEKAGPAKTIESSMAQDFVIDESIAVIGRLASVQSLYEDTLVDIARVHGLGYEEIRLANPGVDAWLPGEGTDVRLPTQFVLPQARRKGLVINIAEYRMYYYAEDGEQTIVNTFPISIGRMDWGTPLGRASIVKKVTDPDWYPPKSIRAEWAADGRELASRVPAGPDNPLGRFAMRLSIPGYLIHGTNRPAGVGMQVTHGCIRMFPEDIEHLFPDVALNTPVQIVNQPYKFGWNGDDLYLEVHPPLEVPPQEDVTNENAGSEDTGVADASAVDPWGLTAITELFIRITAKREADVDWSLIDDVYEQRLGIPIKVGQARAPVDSVAIPEEEAVVQVH